MKRIGILALLTIVLEFGLGVAWAEDSPVFITKWGSYGSGEGEFYTSRGLAVDTAGNVYVADTYNHRIQKFDSTGTFLAEWGTNGSADGDDGFTTEGEQTALLDDNYVARAEGVAHNLTTTGRVAMGDIINNATIEVIHSDGFEDLDGVFQINTAISDVWVFPATSGQGFSIIVWEDLKQIFLVWYTYDTERPPEDVTAILGEPGHRWLTAMGPYNGDTALLDVFVSSGGIFDSGDPPVTVEQLAGATIEIEWTGCNEGVLTYNIPSLGLSSEIPIQRIVLDNVAACVAAQSQ